MIARSVHALRFAEIVFEAAEMNNAALSKDFDEARFRAHLLLAKADLEGLDDLVLAAAYALQRLGPIGTLPLPGYGAAMVVISDRLDEIVLTT